MSKNQIEQVPLLLQAVQTDPKWHFYPGYIQGFLTPSIAGHLSINTTTELDPAQLIEQLVEITGIAELTTLMPLSQSQIDRSPRTVAETIARTCIAILATHKIPAIGEAKIIETEAAAIFRVHLPCFHPHAMLDLLNWLIGITNHNPSKSERGNKVNEVHRTIYKKLIEKHSYASLQGINNMHFLRAAHALGIQIQILDSSGTFIYGMGVHRKIIKNGFTDLSPHLGVIFAQSKKMTSGILRSVGIPTPEHYLVKSEGAAMEAVKKLGFPVVIKPNACDGGRGVFAGLNSSEAVIAAYQESRKHGSETLVERFVEGEDYRLTVHHGRVIKIIHRKAGGITGDGISSISELVRQAQSSDEMQRNFRHYKKNILDLDEEAFGLLAERGLHHNSTPQAGEFVPLRRKNNISSGGAQTVVPLGMAHPDNLLLAERATRYIGLDLAGIDLLIPDISISWLESGAHVIEVNSSPQISIVDTPTVYQEILERMVKNGGNIRVDYRVLADDEEYPTADAIGSVANALGLQASVSERGVMVGVFQYMKGMADPFQAARGLMLDPTIESVLVLLRLRDLTKNGLPTAHHDSIRPWAALDCGKISKAVGQPIF